MSMTTAVCKVKGTGPKGMVNRQETTSNAMSRAEVASSLEVLRAAVPAVAFE